MAAHYSRRVGEEQDAPASDPVLAALLDNRRAFLRFLERRVGSPEAAEDVLQEAFTRAVAKRNTLRDDESAVAWFYRMLRNAVIDLYRHRDASRRALESFGRDLQEVRPGTEIHREVCACVSRVAATLKPEYAAALREVEVDGVPVKTHAERQGITAGNAAVRLHRARQALRREVVATCGACADHGCLDCRCRHPGGVAEDHRGSP
jgi:RNA polymerase sigma factor (sigma-70 family)